MKSKKKFCERKTLNNVLLKENSDLTFMVREKPHLKIYVYNIQNIKKKYTKACNTKQKNIFYYYELKLRIRKVQLCQF